MLRGSYHNGFAPRDGIPAYPSLCRGRVAAFAPCLGSTGATVRDWSGFANHGTLTNMDAGTDWVVSGGRYCLDFDGTNDYISAPNVNAFASGSRLTASVWVKRNSAGVYYELINKWLSTSGSNEDGWLLRWDNGNKLLLTIANSGSYGQFQATNANTSTDWNHIAVVHQFGSTAQTALYVNGTSIAASWTSGGTQVPDSDATSSPITVAALRYQGGPFNYLAGQLDDWAVYNRILTPNEICLLASRRGIAYEMMPVMLPYSAATFNPAWALRQRLILGGGGGMG